MDEGRPISAPASVTSADVKRQAAAAGFDLCGVAPATGHVELQFLREWLDRGHAGEMHYLHRTADERADVRQVLPSARSVVSLGTVYNVERPYSVENADPRQAAVARYAWGDDYHVVIERRLDVLIAWLRQAAGESFEGRAYVDTGPVQERVYAQYAGLGWIGKNTCLINPELGSWMFLSEIICNLDLAPDEPTFDQCGTCTLCLASCPTGALVEPGVLDSTRCLSYLTIENKGAIPADYREAIAGHAYGCDICQEVCPWNDSPIAATSPDPAWRPRAGLDAPRLLDLWRRSDDELRALLKGSAMKRAGVRRFRRNLAVALGNSGDAEAAQALASHDQPTCRDPLVEEHIGWAMGRLGEEV
ncbi:MAG: tRNA epoxyqueuosine(34) reductase QueG [Vicinamibacterales bacterium]